MSNHLLTVKWVFGSTLMDRSSCQISPSWPFRHLGHYSSSKLSMVQNDQTTHISARQVTFVQFSLTGLTSLFNLCLLWGTPCPFSKALVLSSLHTNSDSLRRFVFWPVAFRDVAPKGAVRAGFAPGSKPDACNETLKPESFLHDVLEN